MGALPSKACPSVRQACLAVRRCREAVGCNVIKITARNGNMPNATQTFTLTVRDFTISATPASQTISSGHTASYTVKLTSLEGLTGNVALACGGAPAHSTCTITPGSIMLNGSAQLTVNLLASQSVNHGTFTLTFTGVLDGISHSTNVTLTVK